MSAGRRREIRAKLNQVGELALDEIEEQARAILRAHSNLSEYVQGMGTEFFTDRAGNVVELSSFGYMQPLRNFIEEYSALNLSGVPMRFTAHGAKLTLW